MTQLSIIKRIAKTLSVGRTNQQRKNELTEEEVFIANGTDGTTDAGAGRVWVQRIAGNDADGIARQGELIPVYTGGRNLFNYAGAKVYIRKKNGVLKIVDIDDPHAVASGYEPKALNFARQENRWLYLENVSRGKFVPVGTTAEPSYLLGMRGLVYIDGDGVLRARQLDRQSSKPSLSSYVPTAGNHRYVMVFIRTYDNSIQIFGSTEQSLSTPLSITDLQECIDQSIINEDMPSLVLTLSDAQTSVDMRNVTDDYRQWLNMTQLPGMPNTLTQNWHIRSTRHELVAGPLVVTGALTVAGVLRVIDTDTITNAVGETTIKKITVADSPYALEDGVDVFECDTSGGAITVNFPALQFQRIFSLKITGTNSVSFAPNGSDTVDGVSGTQTADQYDGPRFAGGSSEWMLI